MPQVSSDLPTRLGSSVSCPLMVYIQKYFVIPPYPRDNVSVLILQVHQVVMGGWISQSDEIVQDHACFDDISASLWRLCHSLQQHLELVCHNAKGILNNTPTSRQSVVENSFMVLHVSN